MAAKIRNNALFALIEKLQAPLLAIIVASLTDEANMAPIIRVFKIDV